MFPLRIRCFLKFIYHNYIHIHALLRAFGIHRPEQSLFGAGRPAPQRSPLSAGQKDMVYMMYTEPHKIKDWLLAAGIEPKKKYGQNFLLQPEIPLRIAEACGAKSDDAILEIGPGAGTMTQFLAQLYRKVVAVEIDGSLLPVLSRVLEPYSNVTVLHGDILKTDLRALFSEYFSGMHVSVCANLPYYITTPILMLLLESGLPLDHITVMVQKEVADRLCAPPASSDYGAVTAVVRYYASWRKSCSAFPQVISLRPRKWIRLSFVFRSIANRL